VAIETFSKAQEASEKALEAVQKAATITLKVMSGVSKALSIAGPVFMGLSWILALVKIFLPKQESPEMKAIRKGFGKMDAGIAALKTQLEKTQLMVQVGTVQGIYSEKIEKIHELHEFMDSMHKHNDKSTKKEFISRFKNNYENSGPNLLKGMLGPNTLGVDMLATYSKNFKCNPFRILTLCVDIAEVLNKAQAVEGVYYGLERNKYQEDKTYALYRRDMNNMHQRCEKMATDCRDKYVATATEILSNIYNDKLPSGTAAIASAMLAELTESIPTRAWAVWAYNCYDKGKKSKGQHSLSIQGDKKDVLKKWNKETDNKCVTVASVDAEVPNRFNNAACVRAASGMQADVHNNCKSNKLRSLYFRKKPHTSQALVSQFRAFGATGNLVIYAIRSDKSPVFEATAGHSCKLEITSNCLKNKARWVYAFN